MTDVGLQQVQIIAKQAARKYGRLSASDMADLQQEGALGLCRALQRFDGTRGVTFRTFAEKHIRGAILDYLRRIDLHSRGERAKVRAGEITAYTLAPIRDTSLIAAPTVERQIETRQRVAQLRKHFGILTPSQRATIEGFLVSDDAACVALACGRRKSTVLCAKSLAISKLREAVCA